MTPRRPRLNAPQIASVLERKGFKLVRQSGSHFIYRNAHNKRVTVPFHGSRILHPKTLASILRDAEITWDELSELVP